MPRPKSPSPSPSPPAAILASPNPSPETVPESSPGPLTEDSGAAAERLRGEGAPKSPTERSREFRARKKAEATTQATLPTPKEIAETATAVAVVWSIAIVPLTGGRLRDLDDAQTQRLGEAFAPLVKKYVPLLSAWSLEITGAFVLANVVRECYVKPEKQEQAIPQAKPPATNGAATEPADDARLGPNPFMGDAHV